MTAAEPVELPRDDRVVVVECVAPASVSEPRGFLGRVHAGEIQLRGDDVTGIAVVIGQRVSALANGGEILVSSTVKDLVAGAGIQFDNRAEHPLKGVPGTWQLYGVADI